MREIELTQNMGRKFNLWRCLQSTVESVYQQNVKYLDQHHQHHPAHFVMITTDWSCSQCDITLHTPVMVRRKSLGAAAAAAVSSPATRLRLATV